MEEIYEIQELGETDVVGFYSIRNIREPESEFHKFLKTPDSNPEVKADFQRIIAWIERIGDGGALERYFRPESKSYDNVWAIPIETNTLRLYVLRISDDILILGNGGVKSTATYNEDPVLHKHVVVLSEIDRKINNKIKAGILHIGNKELQGIEKIRFNINTSIYEKV